VSRRPAVTRAVAVGLAALAAAAPAPAASQPAPTGREAVVSVANYFRGTDGTCGGKSVPLRIRLDASPTKLLQIEFLEPRPNAIGPQFRTSGLMAGLVAATLLGRDVHGYRIGYAIGVNVEGPSAGALTTAALLALMRGQTVLSDVAMTGTVNPDGTVGPVSGIPEKLAGVVEAGKKRFGIPRGARMAVERCKERKPPVDVVELGRRMQIEVVEIGDVREAYKLLTGVALPATTIGPVSPEVPADLREAYRTLFEHWMTRYAAAAAILRSSTPGELRDFESIWQVAQRLERSGRAELAGGRAPSAFHRAWLATLNAEVAARGLRGLRTRSLHELQSLVAGELAAGERHVDAQLQAVRALKPVSAVDAGALSLVGGQLATALTHRRHAGTLLALCRQLERAGKPQAAGPACFEALGHITLAGATADIAVATGGWLGRGGPALAAGSEGNAALRSAEKLHELAAAANLQYFDVLVSGDLAKAHGLSPDDARRLIERVDLSYLNARGGIEHAPAVARAFDRPDAALFARLGALIHSVQNSSVAVVQHYSLQARVDTLRRVVGFGDEGALARMTEMADREALRAIGEAAAATRGASSPMLASALDAARSSRDAAVLAEQRLMALAIYWNTTLTARLITHLTPRP
jgi:uncharacterized protein